MKLRTALIAVSVIFSAAMISCRKDDGRGASGKDGVTAQFKANINKHTRAHDTAWDINDGVGLAMLDQTGTAIVHNVYNYNYVTKDGSGDFTPADQSRTIYLPQDGSRVMFRSYYPYNPSVGSDLVIPVDVSSQDNLPAIDFMAAEEPALYTKSSPVVDLRFYHKLSKVVFNVAMDEGMPAVSVPDLTLTVKGMKTTGSYDLLTGTPDFASGTENNITIPATDRTSVRTGIVLPREAGAGVAFVFTTLSGDEYTAVMSDDLALEGGYQYTFNITLKPTPVVVGATIEPWEELDPVSIVALAVSVVGDGSENVPDGAVMNVYYDTDGGRELLADYTYDLASDTWSSDTPVYWEALEDPTTFYASIPDHAAWNGTQLDDYLIARPVTVHRFQNLAFTLSHPAAMVSVRLTSQDGSFTPEELQAMTVTLPDYYMGGTYDKGVFTTGTFPGGQQGTIEPYYDAADNTLSAVIDPQMITAGSVVAKVVSEAGINYDAIADQNVLYVAGKVTVLNIDMSKTRIRMSANIVDWETGQTATMTPKAITVYGTLDATADFFRNKNIRIYQLTPAFREFSYTYVQGTAGYYWQGTPIYWDDQPYKAINLTAFYFPVQSRIPNVTAASAGFPWNLPEDQRANYKDYDLLGSTVSLVKPEYINFVFTHAMSKVIVEIKSPDFTEEEISGATVTLNGFLLDGSVSMTTGEAQPASGALPKSVQMQADAPGERYSALVMPQDLAEGTPAVSVTLPDYPNQTFTGSLDGDLTFTAGKTTIITVTLKKTAVQLSARYQDWIDGDTGSIVIE